MFDKPTFFRELQKKIHLFFFNEILMRFSYRFFCPIAV